MQNPYQKTNTFTRPPVLPQIISYALFIAQIVTFFACIYVNFTNILTRNLLLAFFLITLFCQALFTIICSSIDPSDTTMIKYRNGSSQQQQQSETQINNFRQNNGHGQHNHHIAANKYQNKRNSSSSSRHQQLNLSQCLYCQICTSYVKQNSKHCKVCNRCVQQFDHHCMWINNCIGNQNYQYFILMILSTLANMICYLLSVGLLWKQDRWDEHYPKAMGLNWFVSGVVVVFAFLLLNLIALHMYLIWKGQTTYELIVQRREKEKEEERIEQERIREEERNKMMKVMEERANKGDKKGDSDGLKRREQTIMELRNQLRGQKNAQIMDRDQIYNSMHSKPPLKPQQQQIIQVSPSQSKSQLQNQHNLNKSNSQIGLEENSHLNTIHASEYRKPSNNLVNPGEYFQAPDGNGNGNDNKFNQNQKPFQKSIVFEGEASVQSNQSSYQQTDKSLIKSKQLEGRNLHNGNVNVNVNGSAYRYNEKKKPHNNNNNHPRNSIQVRSQEQESQMSIQSSKRSTTSNKIQKVITQSLKFLAGDEIATRPKSSFFEHGASEMVQNQHPSMKKTQPKANANGQYLSDGNIKTDTVNNNAKNQSLLEQNPNPKGKKDKQSVKKNSQKASTEHQ